MLNKLNLSPQRLFLIDGLGAFLTASLLFAILRTFHEFVGMPQNIISVLSLIAVIFCVYSLSCFFFVNKNRKSFLLVISLANAIYCCLTIGLVIYYYPQMTVMGITYFFVEIVIITGLIFIEFKALKTDYNE